MTGWRRRSKQTEKVRAVTPHLAGVTDVSQCGPASLARCGVPGNNTYRVREMKLYRAATFALRREAFSSPETV